MKSFIKDCISDAKNEWFDISLGTVIVFVIIFCLGIIADRVRLTGELAAKEVFSLNTILLGLHVSLRIILWAIIIMSIFVLLIGLAVIIQEIVSHFKYFVLKRILLANIKRENNLEIGLSNLTQKYNTLLKEHASKHNEK